MNICNNLVSVRKISGTDMVDQAALTSSVDLMKLPTDSFTRAKAKKVKESLQALDRAVQDQFGPYKHLEGVGLAWNEFCMLIMVEEMKN